MLIWTNSDSFGCTYLSSLLEKFHFPVGVVLNSLQTQKDLELVFTLQFLWSFSLNLFLCNMAKTSQILLTDCIYFQTYSVKCKILVFCLSI